MVQLTRLNNHPITVNSDLIKFVEQAPDTVITLITGEKIVVREKADEVVSRIVAFRRSVLEGIFPACDHISSLARPSHQTEQAPKADPLQGEGR